MIPATREQDTLRDEAASTVETGTGPARPPGALVAWARRHIAWILIGAVFSIMLAFAIAGRLSASADTVPLSAHNPSPDGGMAAAEILAAHGVNVTPSDSFTGTVSLLQRDVADETTILLYDRNGFLDAEQLNTIARSAGRLVVIEPRRNTLTGLSADIRQAGVVPEGTRNLEPGCTESAPAAAGSVTARDAFLYTGPELCYHFAGGSAAGNAGIYASSADGRIIVVGSAGIVSNELLDEEGNAALTLGTLGNNSRLIWYLPGIADVRSDRGAPTLNELAPDWVAFAGPWLATVALLAILWRGRRLGPLVFEPLPVIVKAAETAEGRARLYQDSRAVARAADNLRAGSLMRLARHFRLGPDATAEAVVDAAARHGTRQPAELRRIMLEYRPRTEGELVQWAQQIDKLEKEAMA